MSLEAVLTGEPGDPPRAEEPTTPVPPTEPAASAEAPGGVAGSVDGGGPASAEAASGAAGQPAAAAEASADAAEQPGGDAAAGQLAGSGRVGRILQRVQRMRQLPKRARGVVLLVATVATAVAVVFAVRALELSLDQLVWGPLLLAAVVVTPLTIALNAAELKAMAVGVATDPDTVSWPVAVRTVVLATAANLLPIPAGAVIRVQVLRKAGSTTTGAATVTLAAAAIWIGVSLVLAGAVVATGIGVGSGGAAAAGAGAGLGAGADAVGAGGTAAAVGAGAAGGEPVVGWLGVALGVAAVVLGVGAVRVVGRTTWVAATTSLGVVEVATAILHAVRLWLVLLGLGVGSTLWQAVVIGAASPLAAAAGFFPGGIGLAELLGALLAPLAGLAAAAALLAVAVGRLLGLAFTMPVALALGLKDLATRDPDVDELTGLDRH